MLKHRQPYPCRYSKAGDHGCNGFEALHITGKGVGTNLGLGRRYATEADEAVDLSKLPMVV